MKRSFLALAVAGLFAVAVLPLSGVAVATTAVVAATNPAGLTVVPAGVKKAAASWEDWTLIEPGAVFDAYLVTADNDSSNGPFNSDRSRFVDIAGARSVTFDDLSTGTRYFFHVYAVDYTDTGVVVVPPSTGVADDPIGSFATNGVTLTINNSADTVKSGKSVALSGLLTNDSGAMSGKRVKVQSDPYPFDGMWQTKTVKTGGSGQWSLSLAPTVNTRYRALYQPHTGVGGWTRNVIVNVRKNISVSVTPGTRVRAGTMIKYSGKLSGTPANFQPPISGADPVKACLQRQSGTKWNTLKCATVNTDGTYLIKHQPGVDQDGKYRIFSGMGPVYADSWSKTKTITIN